MLVVVDICEFDVKNAGKDDSDRTRAEGSHCVEDDLYIVDTYRYSNCYQVDQHSVDNE